MVPSISFSRFINNVLLSKYIYTSLLNYPRILLLTFTVLFYYKQKQKYTFFINIIFLIFFFNSNFKTRFFFKNSVVNILKLNLRGSNSIYIFISNFIFLYLPLIDSFSLECKFVFNTHNMKFCFFKFPLLFELSYVFNSLEFFYVFLNTFKFQLEFQLKKKRNSFYNSNLLQILKFPLVIT